MVSRLERFWITFVLRFAIGFLCLIACMNQFSYGPAKFATDLSKPFSSTWLGELNTLVGIDLPYYFLYATPYILAGITVLVLTGVLLRPALRLAALMFVCLGLGKYLQGDIATTANDFFFAFLVCVGLFFLSLEKKSGAEAPAAAYQQP